MIGHRPPTGMKPAPPSRETLKAQDDENWRRYHDAVWNPTITAAGRREIFTKAVKSLEALLDFDQKLQKAT